jgi:two-component system phosphate regulon sensor histidine kinase PhoR
MISSFLRVTCVIAAVPVCVLLVLAGWGFLSVVPALLALAAVVLAAVGLAVMWTSDLRLLADMLHRAGTGDRSGGAGPRLLPPEVMGEVQLLSEALGARAALVDRLLRAEEGILERLPDPLIVLGADRAVRRANAAARLAFGDDVQAVLRHPQLRAAIDRALAPGAGDAPQTAELRVPVPVPREIQAMVVPLDSPLSGGAGVLAVLSDRTRERAVERTRADFVANASHELRTPLASLIGFIDTLRGPAADDPPAQARFLDIMAEQAARMNRLIDDLLSLSRIEITEHQAPADDLDIEELTGRILAGFELRIRQRGMRLDYWPEPGLPRVLGDTDQFEQVVQNLVDNALKYGREGGAIRVKITPAAPGGKYPARRGLVLSVADDGQGIPREHLARLTERFYRVDAGRSRAVGGTGLGLAIVKHIVNRHRGMLLIESEAGLGANFSIWLPAA